MLNNATAFYKRACRGGFLCRVFSGVLHSGVAFLLPDYVVPGGLGGGVRGDFEHASRGGFCRQKCGRVCPDRVCPDRVFSCISSTWPV